MVLFLAKGIFHQHWQEEESCLTTGTELEVIKLKQKYGTKKAKIYKLTCKKKLVIYVLEIQ